MNMKKNTAIYYQNDPYYQRKLRLQASIEKVKSEQQDHPSLLNNNKDWQGVYNKSQNIINMF